MKKYLSISCFALAVFGFVANISHAQVAKNKVASENIGQKKRPNIIFLLTDDQRWDAMGAMGNSIIQTPNMDKLANKGVLFQNAYVTTSICCVSRASLLTGQYESKHGIHDFNTDLKPETFKKSYPNLLKEAGYKLGFIGKYGVGHHPPFATFDYVYDTEEGGKAQPDYITIGKNGKPIHDTDTINSSIQEFLGKFANKEPFCLSVSFKAPHEQDGNPPKYVIQSKYKDYYKDVTIPEPVTANPKYWELLPDVLRTETNFGRARWKGLFGTPELYQENVKNYYRLITGVDDVLGDMMKKLEKLGIADNTIIILMGDNGMLLGEHGMEGKWYGHEESIRVPLVIYNPNSPDKVKQYRAQQMALNIDIAPTILSMAGVPVPKEMAGVNLIDVIQNIIPERKEFFYQHYFLGGPQIPRVEAVVTPDFKYINYVETGFEEMFYTKHDSHEIEDLIKNPQYKLKLEQLRNRYNDLKKKHGVPSSVWQKSSKEF
ncbi:sulfatase [Flavobacterium sp. NG2]|uniref:sulfatase family protein n=1 Tax=Flavobacterium sp. NG2 TaxID=3097547 RepID=UPI002A84178A|nr:sulfatase [Flavobacterium sp. NG2]WPR70136.1 sulfatase [Flavobacterium sp. NG2]